MTDRCQDLIDSFYSDWSIVLMLICEELLVLDASGKLEDTELLYNQVAVFVLLLKFPFYLFKSWKFSIVLELTVCLGYRFFSMKYLMWIIGPGWWNYRKEWQQALLSQNNEAVHWTFAWCFHSWCNNRYVYFESLYFTENLCTCSVFFILSALFCLPKNIYTFMWKLASNKFF